VRQRSERVRPARRFGPDKALKELVFKQSHASQLLSKVQRGHLSLGGALDVLDLAGAAQLILTPLLLICVDPLQPHRALWTISMRHVLSAHIPSDQERLRLSSQLESAQSGRAEEEFDQHDHLLAARQGELVLITCCNGSPCSNYGVAGAHTTQVALEGGSQVGVYRSDIAGHLRVIQSGSFVSYLVVCASLRAAQRLERTLKTVFDLF